MQAGERRQGSGKTGVGGLFDLWDSGNQDGGRDKAGDAADRADRDGAQETDEHDGVAAHQMGAPWFVGSLVVGVICLAAVMGLLVWLTVSFLVPLYESWTSAVR
jgi:hypothetical protein